MATNLEFNQETEQKGGQSVVLSFRMQGLGVALHFSIRDVCFVLYEKFSE